MPKIIDLTASEVARHAFNVFLFSGRHLTGAKLIFHALKLDEKNEEALRSLSDFMDSDGTEVFSALTLEYALSDDVGLSGESRKIVDDLLFLAKWSWGFSKHKTGNPHLAAEDFDDRSAFVIEVSKYREFLEQVTDQTGSLYKGYQAAYTLCGTMAGFLSHNELSENVGINECLVPENFTISDDYENWLHTTTDELDALERTRSKNTQKKKRWWKL